MKNYRKILECKFPNLRFDNFNPKNGNEKAEVICPKHGNFITCYKELVRQKFGCRKCKPLKDKVITKTCTKHGVYTYGKYNSDKCRKCYLHSLRKTDAEFIKELGTVDYKILSNYVKSSQNIIIETKYGLLRVTPNTLLKRKELTIGLAVDKTQYYINEVSEIHNNFYDYSKVKYINSSTPIIVICPTHGEFTIRPAQHKHGTKCRKCAYEALHIGFTVEDFIRIAGNRMCTLYLVKITTEHESFIKIGITSRSLKHRLSGHKYDVISCIEDINAEYIYNREKALHKKLYKYSYTPLIKFNGYRECYSINYINELINEFRGI